LIAGDVAKLQEGGDPFASSSSNAFMTRAQSPAPAVTEKAFDEYHLYSLPLPTTLHDRETKQVEFVRAAGVKSQRLFIYDGVAIDQNRYRGWTYDNIRNDESYGTQSNPKVWVMREIKNSEDNKLGMPLPKGKVRFYRQDDDGKLQFVGEDVIDHTARDETLRLYTGNAFDLVGERKRTNIKVDSSNQWIDESFEIKGRRDSRRRAPLPLDELGNPRAFQCLREKRLSNHRVHRAAQTRRREDDHLHGALFVVNLNHC
jgi:hypothetical protein